MKKTKLDVHGAGSLDRRDFLKASALAGAAAGLMGLTGCAPQSNPEKEPTPQTGEEAASPRRPTRRWNAISSSSEAALEDSRQR